MGRAFLYLFVLSLAPSVPVVAQQRSPLDDLPSNIRILTQFGERAVWSPDGTRVAFVHRTLGDAFEVEVATGSIKCLTCTFKNAGFFRVHYLPTGDYILIGPVESTDPQQARWNRAALWFLDRNRQRPPVSLNRRLNEGIATSKTSPTIAWSESSSQYPDRIPEGVSRLMTGEVLSDSSGPHLVNIRLVHQDKWPHCWLEAQDFRRDDAELIYSCYQPETKADVMGVDLASGRTTNYTASPGVYDEPEGIFPDGQYTTVESDRQNPRGDHYVDIWKLRLDSMGADYQRLTHFTDYDGYKASNPTISPDGRFMAFQLAMSKDEAGVGYGILIMDLAAKSGTR